MVIPGRTSPRRLNIRRAVVRDTFLLLITLSTTTLDILIKTQLAIYGIEAIKPFLKENLSIFINYCI